MDDSTASDQLGQIVSAHPPGRSSLIPILQDIQEKTGYLPEDWMRELPILIKISENEIYGVATFYTQFRFRPPAEHTIRVCQGTACHVRGGRNVLTEFERRLGVRPGGTTKDGRFDLERIACIGCCALAPTVTLDGEVHARMVPRKVRSIIDL
ncbi:MAG: NADH-quinone oxidoreductase subunit NuoE [Planctomycetota bacterium]|jgi:NADH-quinone oxidoreductase subunit E